MKWYMGKSTRHVVLRSLSWDGRWSSLGKDYEKINIVHISYIDFQFYLGLDWRFVDIQIRYFLLQYVEVFPHFL